MNLYLFDHCFLRNISAIRTFSYHHGYNSKECKTSFSLVSMTPYHFLSLKLENSLFVRSQFAITSTSSSRRGQMRGRARSPRQRWRSRGGGPRGAGGDRVPMQVQERRGAGLRVLPPLRPQRGRRTQLHAAIHVQEDPQYDYWSVWHRNQLFTRVF